MKYLSINCTLKWVFPCRGSLFFSCIKRHDRLEMNSKEIIGKDSPFSYLVKVFAFPSNDAREKTLQKHTWSLGKIRLIAKF